MDLVIYIVNIIKDLSLALLFITVIPPKTYYLFYRRNRILAEISYGAGLASLGLLSMLGSLGMAPDAINDARMMLVLISASTNGWLAGSVTAILLSIFSLYIGGADIWIVLISIIACLGGGILVYAVVPFCKKHHVSAYLFLGVVVGVGSVLWLNLLPDAVGGIRGPITYWIGIIYGIITWLFSSRFSLEIERSELEERTQQLTRAVRIIRECNKAMEKQNDEALLLYDVCQIIVRYSHYTKAWIGYLDPENNQSLHSVTDAVYPSGILPNSHLEGEKLNVEPGKIAIGQNKYFLSNDLFRDPNFSAWKEEAVHLGFHSAIWLPLIQNDLLIGVLAIYSDQKNAYDQEEIKLLEDLANDLAYGISSLRVRNEKEHYQAELEQTEHQLASFFQVAPVAIMIISLGEGHIMAINDGFTRMVGYRPDEVVGITIYDSKIWVGGEDEDKLLEQMEQNGYVTNFETHFQNKSGNFGVILIQVAPIKYKQKDCILVMGADITEIKRTEEALRLSETTFKMLINSTDDFVLLIDLQGNVLEVNEVLADDLGLTHDQILGTNIYLYYPSELARIRREKAQEAVGLRCSVRFEDHSDNRWVEQIISPVYDDSGEVVSLAVVGRDTTERKRAEESLKRSKEAYRHLTATLEQRVSERTREMEILYSISSAFNSSITIEEVMDNSLKLAVQGLHLDDGAIYHLDGDESSSSLRMAAASWITDVNQKVVCPEDCLVREVVKKKETILFPNMDRNSACVNCSAFQNQNKDIERSFLGVPMNIQGRMVGVLAFFGHTGQSFTVEEIALIETLADQIAISLENTRLRQSVKDTAIKEERARLGRELHDSVTQEIYSLMLFTETARRVFVEGKTDQTQNLLDRIFDVAHQALKEMRLMVYDLHPLALEQAGLVEALRHRLETVEKRSGMEINFLYEGDLDTLPSNMEQELYRIAIEALNNATKHSRASRIWVNLIMDENIIELGIKDDGCGFNLEAASEKGGLGLHSLQERTDRLKGQLQIETEPGQGAYLKMRAPIL